MKPTEALKHCIEESDGITVAIPSELATALLADQSESLYTMDQMREYADHFHLSRMRVLVAEKEAYERHAPKPDPYGYAPIHKNGNYFTRNKSTADYVGGMVPVYTAPPQSVPSTEQVTTDVINHCWTMYQTGPDIC